MGTWREGSLAGYPGGWAEKALEKCISFHRGIAGEPGTGDHLLENLTDDDGSLGMECYCLKGSVRRVAGRYVRRGSGYGHLCP